MNAETVLLERDLFEDEHFTELQLPNIDLSGKQFYRCRFTKSLLAESNWKGAHLEECVFDGCDLTRFKPVRIAARGVEFLDCRMLGVAWTDLGAAPTLAFEACNLQYSSFVGCNLTSTRFARCRLLEVNFFDCRLIETDFTDSDMTGSHFEDCDLREASCEHARGFVINPARNTLKDTRVSLATAVTLAASFGMRVSGFDDEAPPSSRPSSNRSSSSRPASPSARAAGSRGRRKGR